MDNKQLNMLRTLTAGFLLAATLAGCSAESGDAPALPDNKTVPVRISIATETPAGTTKADGTAAIIDPDDRINTLDIYIVDSKGNIQKHVKKSDFTFTQPDAHSVGAITTPIELSPGTKTVYAFANCEDAAFSSLNLGQKWQAVPESVDGNQAFNILSGISTDGGVPMSAQTTWEIADPALVKNGTSETICRIELIRMVAKMTVTINDERAKSGDPQKAPVTSLSITDLLMGNTNLFRPETGKVVLPSNPTKASWSVNNPTTIEPFYLHETEGSFDVAMQIQGEAAPRTATIDQAIPRNSHIPLIIHLTDYSLAIKGSYELAAIGTIAVKKDEIGNGYQIDLPEGASNIDISIGLRASGIVQTTGVTWSCNSLPTYLTDNQLSGEATLKLTGKAIPAIVSAEQEVTVTATFTKGSSAPLTRSFTLTFRVIPLTDDLTKAAPGEPQPFNIEL
ncbi:fimbrial protein [Parabacteroides sp.]